MRPWPSQILEATRKESAQACLLPISIAGELRQRPDPWADGQKCAQREWAAGRGAGPEPLGCGDGQLPFALPLAPPLLVEPPVLLPVGAVDLQQGLQVVVVSLHVLVVHVDVVELLLLLENLLRGACGSRGSGGGDPPQGGPPGNQGPGGLPGKHGQNGAGPVLTGHIRHLYLQALDVGHVHVEERLGLRYGAPDARQGDIGQAAAAVHWRDSGGEDAQGPRLPACPPPSELPASSECSVQTRVSLPLGTSCLGCGTGDLPLLRTLAQSNHASPGPLPSPDCAPRPPLSSSSSGSPPGPASSMLTHPS